MSFSPDPAYQGEVPNLDGGEGHSPHIIFGTNLDLTEDGDTNTATATPSAGEEGEGGDGGTEENMAASTQSVGEGGGIGNGGVEVDGGSVGVV